MSSLFSPLSCDGKVQSGGLQSLFTPCYRTKVEHLSVFVISERRSQCSCTTAGKKKKEILNNSSTVSVYFLNYIFKHLKRECLWSMRCPWRWRTPSSQATQTCWHAVICSHGPGAAKFGTLTYIIPLIKVAVVAAHEWNIVSSFSDTEYTQLCLFAHSWYIKLVGKKKTKQTTKHVKQ